MDPRKYTLSEAAYLGLKERFTPATISDPTPSVTDSGVSYSSTTHIPVEGLSHALSIYSLILLEEWQDTRPQSIIKNHQTLLKYNPTITRLPWYLAPLPDDDDDDPMTSSLSPQERLSLPERWHRYTFRLSLESRRYYLSLAMLYKMETHSGRHGEGYYVSAALEAIGLGWLSPPDRLLDKTTNSYLLPPNPNKMREGFGGRYTHTPDVRAWDLTKEQMQEIVTDGYLGYLGVRGK